MAEVSRVFLSTFRARVATGTRQYELARRARVHPTFVSQIMHHAIPLRRGDPRVVRLAAVLGLNELDAFDAEDGRQ